MMIVSPTVTTMPANQPSMRGAGADRGREGDERAVEHERRDAEREHAERQREAAERGPDERVERRGDDRGHERAGRAVDAEVRQQRAEHEQRAPVQSEDHQAADGESPEPGHGASLARVRVIQPHPMRVTTPHPSGA